MNCCVDEPAGSPPPALAGSASDDGAPLGGAPVGGFGPGVPGGVRVPKIRVSRRRYPRAAAPPCRAAAAGAGEPCRIARLARGGRARPRRGGAGAAASRIAHPHVDVGIDLLEPLAQLLDRVGVLLDLAGQLAHLSFDLLHADLGAGGAAAEVAVRAHRGRRTAIDLPLQHVEVALDAVEPFLHRGVLGPRRRRREQHDDRKRQQSATTRHHHMPNHQTKPRKPG